MPPKRNRRSRKDINRQGTRVSYAPGVFPDAGPRRRIVSEDADTITYELPSSRVKGKTIKQYKPGRAPGAQRRTAKATARAAQLAAAEAAGRGQQTVMFEGRPINIIGPMPTAFDEFGPLDTSGVNPYTRPDLYPSVRFGGAPAVQYGPGGFPLGPQVRGGVPALPMPPSGLIGAQGRPADLETLYRELGVPFQPTAGGALSLSGGAGAPENPVRSPVPAVPGQPATYGFPTIPQIQQGAQPGAPPTPQGIPQGEEFGSFGAYPPGYQPPPSPGYAPPQTQAGAPPAGQAAPQGTPQFPGMPPALANIFAGGGPAAPQTAQPGYPTVPFTPYPIQGGVPTAAPNLGSLMATLTTQGAIDLAALGKYVEDVAQFDTSFIEVDPNTLTWIPAVGPTDPNYQTALENTKRANNAALLISFAKMLAEPEIKRIISQNDERTKALFNFAAEASKLNTANEQAVNMKMLEFALGQWETVLSADREARIQAETAAAMQTNLRSIPVPLQAGGELDVPALSAQISGVTSKIAAAFNIISKMPPDDPRRTTELNTLRTLVNQAAPLPEGVLRWDSATGDFVEAPGRTRTPDVATYLRLIKPQYQWLDTINAVMDETWKLRLLQQQETAALAAARARRDADLATDKIDSAEEAEIKRAELELTLSQRQHNLSIAQMLISLSANPFNLAMAQRSGLMGQIEGLLGITLPPMFTSRVPTATGAPNLQEYNSMTSVEQAVYVAEWLAYHPGMTADDFRRALFAHTPGPGAMPTRFSVR